MSTNFQQLMNTAVHIIETRQVKKRQQMTSDNYYGVKPQGIIYQFVASFFDPPLYKMALQSPTTVHHNDICVMVPTHAGLAAAEAGLLGCPTLQGSAYHSQVSTKRIATTAQPTQQITCQRLLNHVWSGNCMTQEHPQTTTVADVKLDHDHSQTLKSLGSQQHCV